MLTSVTPNQGPQPGANTVILTGGHFTGASVVSFGATAATSFTVNSDTQITATVPAGTGTVNVTVTTAGGTSNAVAYTYVAVPVLTSLSPNQGPLVGGNTVILTGSHFTSASAVKFGATAATSFTVNSDTQITATVPAGTGTVNVTVTTPGGTSNAVAYTYVAVPVLTSLSPNQGPLVGGNTVILTGSHFTSASAVKFGATAATSFTVELGYADHRDRPRRKRQRQRHVTTPGGTSNAVAYTYVAVPVLTSLSPNQGPLVGGNTVILTGSHFTVRAR